MKKTIDFFIPWARGGGMEEVTNAVALYLEKSGDYDVRIIQAYWGEAYWADKRLSFHCFMIEKAGDYGRVIDEYEAYIKDNGAPDIILACVWPAMTAVCRIVADEMGLSIPVVSWIHGEIENLEMQGVGGLDLLNGADAYFAINNIEEKKIKSKYPDATVFKMINPINDDRIVYAEERLKKEFVYIGRLGAEKRVDWLLEGLLRLDESWMLRIIGEGMEKSKIDQLIDYYKLGDRVQVLGWNKNPWEMVKDSAALVLTSETEGSPMAPKEALACGMGVIASNVGDIEEYVTNGINGYVFDKNSKEEFFEILKRIECATLPLFSAYVCARSVREERGEMPLKLFKERLDSIMS